MNATRQSRFEMLTGHMPPGQVLRYLVTGA